MVPLSGPESGIVLTVSAVESGSKSPAVRIVPLMMLSSSVEIVSFEITGGSLTGLTVMNNVSFTQIEGNGLPASQTLKTIISWPLNPALGV